MHPHLPLILTSGVERHILLHSPTPILPCADDLQRTPTAVRALTGPSRGDRRSLMFRALTSGLEPDGDANTIELFDE